MKIVSSALLAAGAILMSGCASPTSTGPAAQTDKPAVERKTVEMEANSTAEQTEQIKKSMDNWRQDGWNVSSISAPHSLPDGRIQWSAQLFRTVAAASAGGYDDRRIAAIQRGQTTGQQLVAWFGPPASREMSPDGRAHLSWIFGRGTDGGTGDSGVINVNLSTNGTVAAYSARRSPK